MAKERKVNKITKEYIVSLFEDMRYNKYDNYRLGFEGDYFGWVAPNTVISRFLVNEKMDWDLQELARNCDENREVVKARNTFVDVVYARTRGIVPKQQEPTLTKPKVITKPTTVVPPVTKPVVNPTPTVQPTPSVVKPAQKPVVTKPPYIAPVVTQPKPVVTKPEPTLTTKVPEEQLGNYPKGLRVSFEVFLNFYKTLLYKGVTVDEKMLRHFYDLGSSERLIVGLLQESYKKVESQYTIDFIERAFTPEAIKVARSGAGNYLKKMYFSVRKDFLLKRVVDFKNYFDKINLL